MSKNKSVKESDWQLFRERVPEYRERYLENVNDEIASILTSEEATPTEIFWEAKERMDAEAQILVDCLDGHSRSNMRMHLLLMYRHGLIEEADLEEFSDELRERILLLAREFGH
jgi:L-lactate utilization protein LutB